MSDSSFQDSTFQKQDYRTHPLPQGEYEGCIFMHCDFSGSELSHIRFSDCEFISCNLSNVKVRDASMQVVHFQYCKMMGILFDTCNHFLFEIDGIGCQLDFSSWYAMKIPKMKLQSCSLKGVNFAGSDLAGAVFDDCDLTDAIYDGTNLEGADLSTAYNHTLDPEKNKLKKAQFSLDGLPGLLTKYHIIVK